MLLHSLFTLCLVYSFTFFPSTTLFCSFCLAKNTHLVHTEKRSDKFRKLKRRSIASASVNWAKITYSKRTWMAWMRRTLSSIWRRAPIWHWPIVRLMNSMMSALLAPDLFITVIALALGLATRMAMAVMMMPTWRYILVSLLAPFFVCFVFGSA